MLQISICKTRFAGQGWGLRTIYKVKSTFFKIHQCRRRVEKKLEKLESSRCRMMIQIS